MSEKTLEDTVREQQHYDDVKRNYHLEFQESEGIPVYTGYHFADLRSLEVKPWARMGGLGAYIDLVGEETSGDNYVCEIPPGQTLKPQRHLFEELVYVLSGRGATTYWTREGGPKHTFEWKEESFFALPANIGYQHFNGDEKKPARIFGKTTLPALFQSFRNRDFIFKNDFVLEDYGSDFFSSEAKIYRTTTPASDRKAEDASEGAGASGAKKKLLPTDNIMVWTANFVPDVKAFDKMTYYGSRGGTTVHFHQSGLVRLYAHMSEFPVGTYKKAHAHPPGRSIIMVTGKGFSLLWQPGDEKNKIKADWKPGSLFGVALNDLPGELWYHQHFNTGSEPARYLVLHVNSPTKRDKHIQVEYTDEDPEIRKLFESELAKSGVVSKMPPECYTDPNFKWKKK